LVLGTAPTDFQAVPGRATRAQHRRSGFLPPAIVNEWRLVGNSSGGALSTKCREKAVRRDSPVLCRSRQRGSQGR
jgi:hypothetical protein